MSQLKRNITITAIILLLGAAIGIAVPQVLADKTSGVRVDQIKLAKILEQEYKKDLIRTYIDDYETERITKLKEDYARKYGRSKEMPNADGLTDKEKTALTESMAASGASPAQVKDAWLQKVIDDNREIIDEQDLAAGSGIYNNLNTGYLFGLAEGGLTSGERQQAETYLQSNLNQAEYTNAIQLYMKYVSLLN